MDISEHSLYNEGIFLLWKIIICEWGNINWTIA